MPAAITASRPRSVPRSWWRLVLPLLGVSFLLADCGPKANTFAPYCPVPRRLADASQLTIYRPGATGQDITDLALQAEIVDVSGMCKDGDSGTVQADATVTFRFSRGPSLPAEGIDVPYLISISVGDHIREQAVYRMRVVFPSNVSTMTLSSEPVHMVFPITKTTNAASYTIWAAFQLTPQQLEYNRQKGQ